MSGAWMGAEREEWQNLLCGYSAAPGELYCDRDASWHGLRFNGGDLIAMEACDEHAQVIRELCDYVHPLVHPCCIPGALFRWPENECFTDWDERAEFRQAVTAGARE